MNDRSLIADAASVTLVVHGIGDHSAADILAAAELGVAQIAPPAVLQTAQGLAQQLGTTASASGAYERVTLPGLKTPEDREAVGLRFVENGRPHILIPIVWSGMRPRLFDRWRFLGAYQIPAIIGMAVPTLFGMCVDAWRCVPRAHGLLAKAIVLCAALLYTVVAMALIAVPFYIAVHVPFWQRDIKGGYGLWASAIFLPVALYILRKQIATSFWLWDFIGDIASYIGNAKRRRHVQGRMRNTLTDVMLAAPTAHIVVIGHSLGSVLVTHSALGYSADGSTANRVLLVTLGSPLSYLGRLFAPTVQSPADLVSAYGQGGAVVGWVNFWRDGDQIGRALDVVPTVKFSEVALGDGGHANYWHDPRLWERVVMLIRWATSDRQTPLSSVCGPSTRYVEDEEVQARAQFLGTLVRIPLSLVLAAPLVWMSATFIYAAGFARPIAWAMWVFIALTLIGWAIDIVILRARGSFRQQLAWGRLWQPWRLVAARLWIVSLAALFGLGFWGSL